MATASGKIGYGWEKKYSSLREAKTSLRGRMDYLYTTLEQLKHGKIVRDDLPSVPGKDLKTTLNKINEDSVGDLIDETEVVKELHCLEKALMSDKINKLSSDIIPGEEPPDLTNFCLHVEDDEFANDFQAISLSDSQLDTAERELHAMEKSAKSTQFFSQMVDIGQKIRLVYASAKSNNEPGITSSIKELKKSLLRVDASTECQKKGLFSGKSKYELYFCNLTKALYENLQVTGQKKNTLNPLGRNTREGPLLFPQFAMPFLAAAKKSNESLGPSGKDNVDELLEMTHDLVEIEQNNRRNKGVDIEQLYARLQRLKSGGKRKTRKGKKRCGKKCKTRKGGTRKHKSKTHKRKRQGGDWKRKTLRYLAAFGDKRDRRSPKFGQSYTELNKPGGWDTAYKNPKVGEGAVPNYKHQHPEPMADHLWEDARVRKRGGYKKRHKSKTHKNKRH